MHANPDRACRSRGKSRCSRGVCTVQGNIKRRDEIFLLICDVLGFSDEERERYGLPRKQSERGKEVKANDCSFASQFTAFREAQ